MIANRIGSWHFELVGKMAGAEGLEPTTTGFGDRCSTN